MISLPERTNQLTETIIGCAIEVHKSLGAGLLESVYRECMLIEMTHAQLRFEQERNVKLTYKEIPSAAAFGSTSSSRELSSSS